MSKAKVFVIMPFQDEFFESYEIIKNKFHDYYEFSNAADIDNQQNILSDIIPPIYSADVILADLTGLNPNVMYELGIAHTLNKKTIIVSQDDLSKLPFDLKTYRAREYKNSYKKFSELLDYLEKHFKGAIDGSSVFSNPVNDFLAKKKVNVLDMSIEYKRIDKNLNNDKGFLDYLAEINDDAITMGENLQSMTDELKQMGDGITQCTNEINCITKNGVKCSPALIRKKIEKVADHISTFSEKLKGHNDKNEALWQKIEKNSLELLKNNFATMSENKQHLISYLSELKGLKQIITATNKQMITVKTANLANKGIAQSLNQAIEFLDEDLTKYLNISDQMIAGIDRIINKSKFVVGEI